MCVLSELDKRSDHIFAKTRFLKTNLIKPLTYTPSHIWRRGSCWFGGRQGKGRSVDGHGPFRRTSSEGFKYSSRGALGRRTAALLTDILPTTLGPLGKLCFPTSPRELTNFFSSSSASSTPGLFLEWTKEKLGKTLICELFPHNWNLGGKNDLSFTLLILWSRT